MTENAAGESLDVVYYSVKQGTDVIFDFKPDHTIKITVQHEGDAPADPWDIQGVFTGKYQLCEGFITLDCPEVLGAEVYNAHMMNGTFSFTKVHGNGYDKNDGVWIGDVFFMLADERDLDFLAYSRN